MKSKIKLSNLPSPPSNLTGQRRFKNLVEPNFVSVFHILVCKFLTSWRRVVFFIIIYSLTGTKSKQYVQSGILAKTVLRQSYLFCSYAILACNLIHLLMSWQGVKKIKAISNFAFQGLHTELGFVGRKTFWKICLSSHFLGFQRCLYHRWVINIL